MLNRDLLERIEQVFSERHVRPILQHVRGHQGDLGNEMADRLANEGAVLPPVASEAEQGAAAEQPGAARTPRSRPPQSGYT